MIASNGNLKLVGTPGASGSTNYYQALNIIGLQPGTSVMQDIGWHSDSQLIGADGKAVIYPGQFGLVPTDNLSDFYNITNVARKNGTITLTNAAKDQYGNSYDLHITFNNSSTTDPGTSTDPTNLIVGRSADGSIEFDAYAGFHMTNVNFSDIYFSRHGTNTADNVTVVSTFADLDNNQFMKTSLSNALHWVPSGSEVTDHGNGYYSGPKEELNGYSSTPKGTLLMVGQGSHFTYSFGWNTPSSYNKNMRDTGYQFNIFGPSATSPVLIPPVLKTSSVNYHYDTKFNCH